MPRRHSMVFHLKAADSTHQELSNALSYVLFGSVVEKLGLFDSGRFWH